MNGGDKDQSMRGAFRCIGMRVDAYRLVGPYDTFEDYCKDVEGLAWSTAQEKIKAFLVHDAIEKNLGPGNPGPRIESQITSLYRHDGAIARFKTEKRIVKTRDGLERAVEVPVAVSNPKKVADQWAAIVKVEFCIMDLRDSIQQNTPKPSANNAFRCIFLRSVRGVWYDKTRQKTVFFSTSANRKNPTFNR